MGAWGTGIFENDFACDWALEIDEGGPGDVFAKTFSEVTESLEEANFIAGNTAERSLAALLTLVEIAEGVTPTAVLISVDEEDDIVLPESLKVSGQQLQDLIAQGIGAVTPIIADPDKCESYELWFEEEDRDEWKAGVEDLLGRARILFT
ncbi:MAG: DUF4259 domain-containing protein [Actinomycetaceae bacterium]|nr:DUF4259 domain-containing protein [Actinomycetaceae bacterium]